MDEYTSQEDTATRCRIVCSCQRQRDSSSSSNDGGTSSCQLLLPSAFSPLPLPTSRFFLDWGALVSPLIH